MSYERGQITDNFKIDVRNSDFILSGMGRYQWVLKGWKNKRSSSDIIESVNKSKQTKRKDELL